MTKARYGGVFFAGLFLLQIVLSQVGGDGVYVREFSIPGYPPIARNALVQGEVAANVRLAESGAVDEVTIVRGHPLLAGHVQNWLKQWHFGFAGRRTDTLELTFTFVLEGPASDAYRPTEVSGSLPQNIRISTNPPEPHQGDVIGRKK